MTGTPPALLALDFDGVVCDGVDEMLDTSWRTFVELTGRAVPEARRAELQARFTALRPAIESGWEMVALFGLLLERNAADDAALRDGARWAEARDAFMRAQGFVASAIAHTFDGVRSRWMTTDPQSWLARHRFYPGIADWLRRLVAAEQLVYVISTKGKPFIEALFAWQTVPLPPDRVIGRQEPKREKWDVLRGLCVTHGVSPAALWFVEDRLATLVELRRRAPDLASARVLLADWGYIFADRDPAAARAAGIPVLTLTTITDSFDHWPA